MQLLGKLLSDFFIFWVGNVIIWQSSRKKVLGNLRIVGLAAGLFLAMAGAISAASQLQLWTP